MNRRPLIIAIVGALAVSIAIGFDLYKWDVEISENKENNNKIGEQNLKISAKEKKSSSPQKKENKIPLGFDVIRVEPDGSTVIAGRSKPNQIVTIIDNEEKIGSVKANQRGQWVFIPEKKLKSGNRQLKLETKKADGKSDFSEETVIYVPSQDISKDNKDKTSALILKIPKKGVPSHIIQNPARKKLIGPIKIETIDYDEEGMLIISGKLPVENQVFVYLDNMFIGKSKPDSTGSWVLRPKSAVKAGVYSLRADQIGINGNVTARISMPFSMADTIKKLPTEPFIIVQPGNSLWRLATRTYGSGLRYTTIFNANRDQIRNPDLIYPGQVFALPENN